jgi:hypothetical protein
MLACWMPSCRSAMNRSSAAGSATGRPSRAQVGDPSADCEFRWWLSLCGHWPTGPEEVSSRTRREQPRTGSAQTTSRSRPSKFQAFGEKLMPLLQQAGINPVRPVFFSVHNFVNA